MKESVETKIKHSNEIEGDRFKKHGHTRCELCVAVKESIEVRQSIEVKESIETNEKH